MAVTALNRPGLRTISGFRRRHLAALAGLFEPVLLPCRTAGLVQLGHVALDGTKPKANASKHRAMSYARMTKSEPELAAAIAEWLAAAEAADAAKDAALAADKRGDELPDWVAGTQRRLAKIREARIREAKAALEAQAETEAEEKAKRPKKHRSRRSILAAASRKPRRARDSAQVRQRGNLHVHGAQRLRRRLSAARDGDARLAPGR